MIRCTILSPFKRLYLILLISSGAAIGYLAPGGKKNFWRGASNAATLFTVFFIQNNTFIGLF